MTSRQPLTPPEYRMFLENIDAALIGITQQGRISLFNPAAEDFTGLSEKNSLGQSFFDCFSHQKTLCYLVRTTLDEGRSISDHETIILKAFDRRQERPVSVTVSPMLPSSGPQQGAIIILHDLTQVRSLESAARHADHLSMVGNLASGLAHEIKNPLGGIRGAAQLLQMELEERCDLREYTELIIRESERVNRIIEELLDLSRPRPSCLQPVNLNQLLDEVVQLQKNTVIERGITFRRRLDPSIPEIPGDADLLTRLFLNLVKNACEASPDDSEILLETRIDSEYHLSLPGSRPTTMVQIRISDQGPGIPRDKLEQLFTPFYTTKSGGSGLGLPICQKIVSNHGGLLHFHDRSGGGTRVQISLPLSNQQP